MSTVTLSQTSIIRAREMFVLYAKKAAFTIEEYADVGAVYKRLMDQVDKDEPELTEIDVKYLVNVINVCSQRVTTEVQNYKPISDLLDTLVSTLKEEKQRRIPK